LLEIVEQLADPAVDVGDLAGVTRANDIVTGHVVDPQPKVANDRPVAHLGQGQAHVFECFHALADHPFQLAPAPGALLGQGLELADLEPVLGTNLEDVPAGGKGQRAPPE
jgi:hypothetical protein